MHGTGRVSSPWPQRAQPPWGSLLNSTCGDFTLAPWNCPPWCIYTTAIGKRYTSGFCFFFFFPKEPVSQYRAEATFPGSARIQASATVPATQIALDNLDFWPRASSHCLFTQGPSAANACWRST